MGLTDYESKIYLSLASQISADAFEISDKSGVPRSRTYDVLKSLHNKGFVDITRGKPLKYTVVPPQEVFEKSRQNIKEQRDEGESELKTIYENQIPKFQAPIWLIYGTDKIVKKEIEIIARAKDSLHIVAGLMFQDEIPQLNESLKKSLKRGVQTRIISAQSSITDGEKIDIYNGLNELDCEIKTFQIPYLKAIIRDKKEMLLVFCKFTEGNVISQSSIGVWNQYTEFVETITDLYNLVWTMDLFNMATLNTKTS